MAEYLIVPKRMMEQELTQIQLNKEPPEAMEVVNLDALTQNILHRKNMSDWEKADLLSSTLERFLALKPKAIREADPVATAPVISATPAVETAKTPLVSKKRRRRQADPTDEVEPQKLEFAEPTTLKKKTPKQKRRQKEADEALETHRLDFSLPLTDLDEIARFATGKSLIKLHFRPARSF